MAHDTIPDDKRIYPQIVIKRITNPNRFYAIPLIGVFIKIIMTIPVFIEIFALSIATLFVLLINSFIVLFTGKYWIVSYDLNLALIRIVTKVNFFISGLTNKYPGFSLQIEDEYSVDIPYNKNPNRFYAFPIFGGLVRILLLIPYFIYQSIIGYASSVSLFVSWIPVLFNGYYPESSFEIVRDSTRINQAITAYMVGLSDTYPSFWISMNHKKIKIILIIFGVLLFLINTASKNSHTMHYTIPQQKSYQHYLPSQISPTSSYNTSVGS